MKKAFLLLLFIQIFCKSSSTFAQKVDVFQPSFWMNNFTQRDTLEELKLNSYLPLLLNSKTNWLSRNKTKSNNSLFIVYKSNKSSEDLVSIIGNKQALFINSNTIKSSDTLDISGYNEFYGELLDVSFGDIGQGIIMLNNKLVDTNVYEIILDNNLTSSKTSEIRTYLSLKYGIDLIDYKQYSYKGNNLWKKTKNNDNIFGIGKFDFYNLNQRKSIHSKNKDISIKFSNDSLFNETKDGSFVLIGDNSKSLNFEKNKCLKKWSAQSNIKTTIDIEFEHSRFNKDDENYEYYVVVGVDKYPATLQDNKFVFKNIELSNGISDIELLRSKLKFDIKIEEECNSMFVKIDDVKAGTKVLIKDENSHIVFNGIYENSIQLDTKLINYFDVEVTLKEKKSQKRVFTTFGKFPKNPLKTDYYIDNEHINIVPKDNDKATNIYTWYNKDGQILSKEKTLTLKNQGNYKLSITNDIGCVKEYAFNVLKKKDTPIENTQDSWSIYPNPSLANHPINSSFRFSKEKEVQISIFSLDGKLVKSLPSKRIKEDTIVFELQASATYIVVAYIDNNMEIKKIIVE